ncbi:MAG: alpha/beta hydrolase [Proteobacteria bacterium]|nr:alpha/beta hydrolase [Pseudomonadota bacterium]
MRLLQALYVFLLMSVCFTSYAEQPGTPENFGQSTQHGNYAEVNGIRMYYEVYGQGEPMVLIHGSGESIEAMKFQIRHFAKNYRVLVADSRAHGKSGTGTGRLTYEQMADDWSALMDSLNMQHANIFGWSDGGNIGLLLAIHHPDKVAKLVTMGANLRPDSSAVYPWAREWVASESRKIEDMLASGDKSQDWNRLKQQFGLLREQPTISLQAAQGIIVPVLVMAGDRDIIRMEHTVQIFQTLPNAQLAILPGETHFAPHNHPDSFNTTAARFFQDPFSKPDTKDLF